MQGTRSRRSQRKSKGERDRWYYDKIFKASNEGPPWFCHFCGGVITELGRTRWSLVIHHVDEDFTNDDESNLTATHRSCHSRHHQPLGVPAKHGYTKEIMEKTAAKLRGRPHVEPQLTCECGKICHAGPMKRHTTPKGHKVNGM